MNSQGSYVVVDTFGGSPAYQPDPILVYGSCTANTGYPVSSWPATNADQEQRK